MRRSFKIYSLIWSMCFGLFQVIAFVIPTSDQCFSAFWVGIVCIDIAFVGQLLVAHHVLKKTEGQKLFYGTPSLLISYIGLAVVLGVGSIPMVLPTVPLWLTIIVCVGTLIFSGVIVLISGTAGEAVAESDKIIKSQTRTLYNLTAKAELLKGEAKTKTLKVLALKVYEALRYSDPVSAYGLVEIHERIQAQFTVFADAIRSEDGELAEEVAAELLLMIEERNKKCRMMK